jgi:hypothetical protein
MVSAIDFERVMARRGYRVRACETTRRFTVDTGGGEVCLDIVAVDGLDQARELVPTLRDEAARRHGGPGQVQEVWHPGGCVLFCASGPGAGTLLDVVGADRAVGDLLLPPVAR